MVAATIRRMASGTCSRRAGALSMGQSSLVASLTPPPGSAALLFSRAARQGSYGTDVLASGMPRRHDRAANLVVAKRAHYKVSRWPLDWRNCRKIEGPAYDI